MKIHCSCGHEYETRTLPCPDGVEGCLVYHTDRDSYTCEKCGAFNAPRLSDGVREEIGMGVMNTKSILALDLYSDRPRPPPTAYPKHRRSHEPGEAIDRDSCVVWAKTTHPRDLPPRGEVALVGFDGKPLKGEPK